MTILASILLLLVSASVAHAECAWVLWDRYSERPVQAFNTKADCETYRKEEFPGRMGYPSVCLPDTVGPRGLKEGK